MSPLCRITTAMLTKSQSPDPSCLSAGAEVTRCGASCLLAPSDNATGASKQLAPHLYTAKLLPGRLRLSHDSPRLDDLLFRDQDQVRSRAQRHVRINRPQ